MTYDTMEYIKEMKARGNSVLVGVDTGFEELNRMTTGFGKGDLVSIAARPAMGKTSFVLNIALKSLELNKGVAIFSLEMPAEQLMMSLLSAKTQIPLQNVRKGDLNQSDWNCSDLNYNELDNNDLLLFYNYRPWKGETFCADDNGTSEGNVSLILEDVKAFSVRKVNTHLELKVQLSVQRDDINVSVSKQKVAF